MSNNTPFITVGIASYNYAQSLPRAFEAIKAQTYTDYEILYCDDGSTDHSVAVIEGFIQDNPDMRIRLVRGDNGGIMVNKNRIIDHARGRYVMICDADDWMDADCLEKLAEAAQRTHAARVVTEVRNVRQDASVFHVQTMGPVPSKWNQTIHHGAIYDLSIIEKHHIRFDLFPDDFCFIELFNCYGDTYFLKEQLYNWWIHTGSTGHTLNEDAYVEHVRNILHATDECIALISDEDDRLHLEAEVMKWWLFDLVNGAHKCANLSEVRSLYTQLRAVMEDRLERYLHNPYISCSDRSPFRASAQREIAFLASLERMHLLKATLCLWQVISHGRKLGY